MLAIGFAGVNAVMMESPLARSQLTNVLSTALESAALWPASQDMRSL